MNNITYGIVKEMRYCKDMERVSYGIAAYLDYKEDDMGTVVASVSDISEDRKKVEELVDRCNRLELSVEHINGVVMDFVASN